MFQYMFEFVLTASLRAANTTLAVSGSLNIQIGSYCAGWDKINIIKHLDSDSAKVVQLAGKVAVGRSAVPWLPW